MKGIKTCSMKNIVKYLLENKDWIALLSSILIGVATIIISIISAYYVCQQTKIYREQTNIQKKQNQPIFVVKIWQQQDGDDGKYGTEILEVHNYGSMIQKCAISTSVFYRLVRNKDLQNDTIYAQVLDYFNSSVIDNSNDTMLERMWGTGNNRIFAENYMQAILVSKKGDGLYFLDKIILSKITYTDILGEKYTLYFDRNNEISEEIYNKYFDASRKVWNNMTFSLNGISFDLMKKKLEGYIPCDNSR